jgi:hypothetical protein
LVKLENTLEEIIAEEWEKGSGSGSFSLLRSKIGMEQQQNEIHVVQK